jgi:outer membrane protein assembly factor BamB
MLRAVQAAPTLDGRLLIARMPLQTADQTWPVDFAIAAMDAKTGKQVWRRVAGGETKSVYYNTPVVQGNVVYTGMATYKGGITEFSATALNASTGETLWTTYLGAGSDPFQGTDGSPVAVRDGLVWIESPLYSLSALDALTGELRLIYHYTPERRSSYRSFDYGVSVINEPISLIASGAGPIVFAPRWGVDVIALDPESGKLLWSSPKGPGGTTIGSIFGADDKRVYICGDYLQALSLADGAREWDWSPQAPSSSVGYAALAGDRIYLPIEGKIHVRAAADGAELEVLDTSPVLGDSAGLCSVIAREKMLLVGTPEKLIAFGPK